MKKPKTEIIGKIGEELLNNLEAKPKMENLKPIKSPSPKYEVKKEESIENKKPLTPKPDDVKKTPLQSEQITKKEKEEVKVRNKYFSLI